MARATLKSLIRRRSPIVRQTLAALAALHLVHSAHAEDAVADFGARLATLRTENEQLASEITRRRAEAARRLEALDRERDDLAAQVRREELRIAALRKNREAAIARRNAADAAMRELTPAIRTLLTTLKSSITNGLPFRRADREAELTKLLAALDDGSSRPAQVLARAWSAAQDELRLSRESGLYRQPIDLNGEAVLADVVRIGMVALFFETSDQRRGYVTRDGDTFSYKLITEPAADEQIANLFASFRRQIRTGFFELPNAIVSGGAQ